MRSIDLPSLLIPTDARANQTFQINGKRKLEEPLTVFHVTAVFAAQWWGASGVSQRKEEIEYESKVLENLNREWLELCRWRISEKKFVVKHIDA